MNILIDTHIFLWLLKEPEKISQEHTAILKSPHTVYLSAISIAELMIKSSVGKLTVDFDPVDLAEKSGLKILDFNGEDANTLKLLPLHHKDPFDRMLISQSINRDLSIMTNDSKFKLYDCSLV